MPADHATNDMTPARTRWILIATMLASSLAFIDGSVVNVALEAIARDLGGTAAGMQWTINAYALPLSALLLIGGAAGDHLGRRRMLIAGVALFAVASLACAAAPDLAVLLAARAAQGVGAAMLMPNSLAILGNAFSGEARGRAVGTWAAAGAIAAAAGPPLGGWLVDAIGWRAIFAINLPVAIGAILIAARHVEESAAGEQPLDGWGAALATLALGALAWGLTRWSGARVADAATMVAIGAGLVGVAAFLLVERHLGQRAMMPLSLFGSRAFVGLTLLTFLLYGALGGLLVLLPFTLIVAGGYSPLAAGLSLLPFAILIGTMSRLTGRLSTRIGPRWPLTIGPAVVAAGFVVLARIDPAAGYWRGVAPGLIVVAIGMAGAVAPLTTTVLSSVDGGHTGTASGFNSAISRTGGLIATALAGVVLANPPDRVIAMFRAASLAGAGAAILAAVAALLTLQSPQDAEVVARRATKRSLD